MLRGYKASWQHQACGDGAEALHGAAVQHDQVSCVGLAQLPQDDGHKSSSEDLQRR